jgi:hypothetical protein
LPLLRSTPVVIALLVGNALGTWSEAAPIISVDLDAATPGIQSNLEGDTGALIDAAVAINTVDAVAPLNAFDFDLTYDGQLAAQALANGDFLLSPTVVVISDVIPPDVNLAVSTLLPTGAVGDGVLAEVTFQALSAGVALLELSRVALAAPFGIPIAVGAINNAEVAVRQAPAPASVLLISVGLGALASIRRHRQGSRAGLWSPRRCIDMSNPAALGGDF